MVLQTPLTTHAHLQVVYEPALLVHSELAVLFMRFMLGHGPAVWAAVAQQQKRLEEVVAQVGGRNG